MRSDALARRAEELAAQGAAFATATVVRAQRPTSAHAGDVALITSDGNIEGFVGGICAEHSVRLFAWTAMKNREPILLKILPFRESAYRYLVFNARTREVARIDAIGRACRMLPERNAAGLPERLASDLEVHAALSRSLPYWDGPYNDVSNFHSPTYLFRAGADLSKLDRALCDSINAAKAARGGDQAWDPAPYRGEQGDGLWVCPAALETPFSLAPGDTAGKAGGLAFLIDPYVVGPYAEGVYTAVVPAAAFSALLSPEWADQFGGAPAPEYLDRLRAEQAR